MKAIRIHLHRFGGPETMELEDVPVPATQRRLRRSGGDRHQSCRQAADEFHSDRGLRPASL
jgi:hypothetical protein